MHFTAPAIAAAALLAGAASATPFALLTLRSGTDLQFAAVNASDGVFKTNVPTTAQDPPANVGETFPDTTSFILGDDGSLIMNTGGTSVQYAYVAPQTGLWRITPAHTGYIPDGGLDNFTISGSPPLLSLVGGGDPYACGTGPDYTIEFSLPALNTANCISVELLVSYLQSDGATAWQY